MGLKSLLCLAVAALVVGSPDAVDDHCTDGSCLASDEQLALVQRQATRLHLSPDQATKPEEETVSYGFMDWGHARRRRGGGSRPTKRPTKSPTKGKGGKGTSGKGGKGGNEEEDEGEEDGDEEDGDEEGGDEEPTTQPTMPPTKEPTKRPTQKQTKEPTKEPTKRPTYRPTKSPTKTPTTEALTATPTETPTDSPTQQEECSQSNENLNFAKATVIQNNLGNHGPDSGEPVLRLQGVLTMKDQSVDLVVRNTTSYSRASEPKPGNRKRDFIGINVLGGTSVNLNFAFFNTLTGEPVKLHEVHLTFLDLDQSKNGKLHEKIHVLDLNSFVVTPDSEVAVKRAGQTTTFEAKKFGPGCDNPDDPMKLENITCTDKDGSEITTDQRKRSAMMVFKDVSDFNLELEVPCKGDCKSGRNFLFAWTSQLAEACTHPDATGDPHMTNIRGQTYNLFKTGLIEFLRLPFDSTPANANLTVSGTIEALQGPGATDKCKQARYIKNVIFRGGWLDDRQLLVSINEAGEMYTALDGTHMKPFDAEVPIGAVLHVRMLDEETLRLRAGKASIDVMSAGNHGGKRYFLNLDTRALAALNIKIGGLLGEDDFTDVSTPPPGCQMISQTQTLTMKQAVDPGTSFAAASLE